MFDHAIEGIRGRAEFILAAGGGWKGPRFSESP
jgi:hypothetical protein